MEDLTKLVAPLLPLLFAFTILSQLLVNWLTALYLVVFRPTIHIYAAGRIEVSFGTFGPSITLFGTMQAERGDFFVTRMELSVQRSGSDVTHRMEWGAFAPYLFGLEESADVKYELVTAFALKKDQPFKYNIVFTDDTFVNEETQTAKQIRDDYQTFINGSIHALAGKGGAEAFYKQPNIQAIAQAWQQKIYWQAGDYDLQLSIKSTRKTQHYTYHFHLSETDCAALQSNAHALILSFCGEKVRFARAYTAYQGLGEH